MAAGSFTAEGSVWVSTGGPGGWARHHGGSGEHTLGSTQQAPHEPVVTVIGTDASGLAGLPAPSLALVRAAAVLLAPRRLLAELEPWWRQEQAAGRIPAPQPCPQLLASDRPASAVRAGAAALPSRAQLPAAGLRPHRPPLAGRQLDQPARP
jgi:hypothetical protein